MLRYLTISTLIALLPAAFFIFAAWSHNPQGEFHNKETGINWPDLLVLGLVGFIPTFLITYIYCLRNVLPKKQRKSNYYNINPPTED